MNQHLSEDQFSKCIAGQAVTADLQHVEQCPECSAELERFGTKVALFREAIQGRIDSRVEFQPAIPLRCDPPRVSPWRWVLAAAAASGMVVLAMLPFFKTENTPAEDAHLVSIEPDAYLETSPDAIMARVNFHLSRTVPAPMEPILSLIRENEFITETGGVQ